MATDKPNVLLILCDDVGWFDVGAYHRGIMGTRTPNIDRIAEGGVMFTDAYAQASCTAGRAAFITGQIPLRTGLTTVGMPGAEHVSRRHAQVYVEGGVWKVKDLGSTNGVFVRRNGEAGFSPRLQEPAELHNGDEIAFGNTVFLFREV